MSLTIMGIVIAALGKIAQMAGYTGESVTAEHLTTTVATVVQVLGIVVAHIGRGRYGDLHWYGRKKYNSLPETIDSLPDVEK